jgi:hypothetical protein
MTRPVLTRTEEASVTRAQIHRRRIDQQDRTAMPARVLFAAGRVQPRMVCGTEHTGPFAPNAAQTAWMMQMVADGWLDAAEMEGRIMVDCCACLSTISRPIAQAVAA